MLLGGLCSVVFAIQLSMALKAGKVPLLSGGRAEDAYRAGAMISSLQHVAAEPFRLLSSVYAHHGLLHFGMNMLGFVSLARSAEGLVGSGRTIIAFVFTAIAGNVATVGYRELSGEPAMISLGASGGILGVMGLLLGVLVRRGDPAWKNLAINTLFYAVLFGFAVNATNSSVLINNAAHIGGLVAGLALGLLWYRRGARESAASTAVAGVAFLASVASVALSLVTTRGL
ncbi:MAG: rhomboid family intramembrane serine protease [Polyangiaceae bacterium]|nr:rhomboid family intramembrane serine protease [Polyangiaceae bacterium]